MPGAVDFGGGNKVGFVSGLDYAALREKKLSRVDRDLNKIQDDRLHAKEEVIEFARLKKDINKLYDYVHSFSNSIFGTSPLSSRQIIAPKDITENYAIIQAENGAKISSYDFKIEQIATAEVLKSKRKFNDDDKIKKGIVTVTLNDNGLKSDINDSQFTAVTSSTDQFKPGSFRIGNALVTLEEGDSLYDITKKINQAASAFKENITAEIKDNGIGGDYYIWIKTKKLGDGENTATPFKITDDNNILNGQFDRKDTQYVKNGKVEIELKQEISISDFVNKFNSYSKKTYITASLEDLPNSKKTLRFQSTLTGATNKIEIDAEDSQGTNLLGKLKDRTPGQDTKVNFDGTIEISTTNQVNHNGIQVTAMKPMSESVKLNVSPSADGFEELQNIYNTLVARIAKNIQKKDSIEEFYKYADSAALSDHHLWLNNIQNTIQEFIGRLDKNGNSLLNFGITFTDQEINPINFDPFKYEVKPKEEPEDLKPVTVFLMEIDKNKIQMNINQVMGLLNSDFQSSQSGFRLLNTGLELHTQRVNDFEYNLDFSKVKLKTNLSKQYNKKSSVIGIKEEGSILLNGEKIELAPNDTVETFVDKVNKVRHKSGIKALIADEKIGEDRMRYRILLDKNYNSQVLQDYETKGKSGKEIKNVIRKSLSVFDKDDILGNIFTVPTINSKTFNQEDSPIVTSDSNVTINGINIQLTNGATLKQVQEKIKNAIDSAQSLKGKLEAEIIPDSSNSSYQLQIAQVGILDQLNIEDKDDILGIKYSKVKLEASEEVTFYDTTNVAYVKVNLMDGNTAEKYSFLKLKDPLDPKKGADIKMIDDIEPAPMELRSQSFEQVNEKLRFNGEIKINDQIINLTKSMTLEKVKKEINDILFAADPSHSVWADIVREQNKDFRIIIRKSDVSGKLNVEDKKNFFKFTAPSTKLKLKDLELRYSPKTEEPQEVVESKISIHQGVTQLLSVYLNPIVRDQGVIDVMVKDAQQSDQYAESQEQVLKDRKKEEIKRFDYEMGVAEGKFDKYNQQIRFVEQWTKERK